MGRRNLGGKKRDPGNEVVKCARTIFIHELSISRSFSDTTQLVNKNRTKHVPCCNAFI